ncbi:sodium/proline symporter [Rubinisphaera italica]|uniref:Sodium/proline symporter n=1 Tax=Rubinisphaera italica TaxID=2527969 RepID=A0A5C5XC53_9PLAN|nr:sodium/proline symporter [Rubinisphaera italica]TWT60717.1 Sodium/proline symporter [Rubinisphaera italica]
MTIVVVSFLFFLGVFVVIGLSSARARKSTTDDYLLANRSVPPWLAALSAVATNNSGFMFIGQIAYSYRVGIESIWMMIGWIVGDFIAWLLVHPRVRRESERLDVATVPALLGTSNSREKRVVIILAGLMTFVLLGVYAAAQLKAGSTALQALFGWKPEVGAIIGAVIVVLYCFSGGIRASIWTDAAQSFVMILAMVTLLITASFQVGTPVDVWNNLSQQDPELVRWFPRNLKFGFAMYLLGMTFGGFGAIGQPHILVRFMTIRSVDEIQRARMIYFLWFIPFFIASIAVGLYARAYMPDLLNIPLTAGMTESQATELAMPEMARRLLPDVLIGLTLAGLFSATMSTADSQILVCSGSITQDINPRWKNSYLASKLATLAVAGLALIIALFAGQGVFSLVLIAWSALGAGLGPALMLRLLGVELSSLTITLMMSAGVGTVIAWNTIGYDGDVFKLLPGMLASFLMWPIGSIFGSYMFQEKPETT